MANTRLSDLSVGGAIASTDLFYAVETAGVGGVSKDGDNFAEYIRDTYNASVQDSATVEKTENDPADTISFSIVDGSVDTTQLADGGVTLAKQAALAQGVVIGRASGAGTGVPTALTAAQQFANVAGSFSAADKFWYSTGAGTGTEGDITSAGRALLDDADAAAQRTTLSVTETLTANRTYYVNNDSTGSDSNDGLTAGTPFATIQKAIDVASGLSIGALLVTISIAAGTYSENLTVKGIPSGQVLIEGDTTTPANVVVSHGSSAGLTATACVLGQWVVKGIHFSGTSGACLDANGGGIIFDQCKFTTNGGSQLFARSAGVISIDTGGTRAYEIDGDPNNHITAATQGVVAVSGSTVTVTGTPAWGAQMVNAITGGLINADSMSISGGATGKRYNATGNGVINALGGASYFPGNVAGTTATGGQYL